MGRSVSVSGPSSHPLSCLPPSLPRLTALPSQSAEQPWPFIHTGSHSHDGGRYGAATPVRLSFIPTLPARLVLQLVRDPHGSLPLSPSLCCCSLPLKLVSAPRHPFIDSWSSTPSSHRPCSGSRQSAPIGPSGKWLAGWLVVVLLLLLMMYSGFPPLAGGWLSPAVIPPQPRRKGRVGSAGPAEPRCCCCFQPWRCCCRAGSPGSRRCPPSRSRRPRPPQPPTAWVGAPETGTAAQGRQAVPIGQHHSHHGAQSCGSSA